MILSSPYLTATATEAAIEVDSSRGLLHFEVLSPGQRALHVRNVQASLRYSLRGEEFTLDLVHESAVSSGQIRSKTGGYYADLISEDSILRAHFEVRLPNGSNRIELAASAALKAPTEGVKLESVTLFQTNFNDTFLSEYGFDSCRFWRNWHDIWFPTGSIPLTGPEKPEDIDRALAYHFGAVYSPAENTALTFGYQLPNGWIDAIEVTNNQHIVASNLIGAPLTWKQPVRTDRLMVTIGEDLNAALTGFHELHVGRRTVEETKDHFGWNSWEAYQTKITAADIEENLEAIAKLPWLQDGLRYIIIDDGWQVHNGNWTANEKFPGGVEVIAEKIKAAGFQPGIWTAPFLVSVKSDVVRDHPDWLLQDGDGPITINNHVSYLDPTHPEARAFIAGIYRDLYARGYRYFKTDFLVEACHFFVPGRKDYRPTATCFDPQLGIMAGMRAAMQTIRAAMGEDSFWLGCGTDIGSGALLMDASRTGGDIAPYWTRVPNQARSVIHHFHMHGNLFLADPDFTLIKGTDTFHPEYLDVPAIAEAPYVVDAWSGGRCFDAADARSWATLVIMSGGLINLSDKIFGLNQTGLDIIKTALEYAGGHSATALDLENSIPSVLLREEPEFFLLGLVNWDNETELTLDLSSYLGIPYPDSGSLHEIWTGQDFSVTHGPLNFTLPPHGSLLFKWEK